MTGDAFLMALLRLKVELKVHTDKAVAEALGMKKESFNSRKTRGSFPVDKLFALIGRRPDLKVDAHYVLTGMRAGAPAKPHLKLLVSGSIVRLPPRVGCANRATPAAAVSLDTADATAIAKAAAAYRISERQAGREVGIYYAVRHVVRQAAG